MKKVILKIGGMSCSACSNNLEKNLLKQKGIISANVNLVLAQALIEYEDNLDIIQIEKMIKKAGFESLGIYNNDDITKKNYSSKKLLILFTILAILIFYISMASMLKLPIFNYLNKMKNPIFYSVTLFGLTLLFLGYGYDIFKNGLSKLIRKKPNMNTLVSLGVIASFLYSTFGMIMTILGKYEYVNNLYFESSALVIFFVKLGRFIDSSSKEKTKEAIKELVQITPNTAIIKKKNDLIEITIDEVKKGDILVTKPGMKIAVDGVIVKGNTYVDEAFITGESRPVKKDIGDKVIAGSINHDGYIEYQAEKIGKESTISEMVKLVIEATNTKTPIAKEADKICGYFVPTIMIIALITLIGHLILKLDLKEAINAFVTVLVVACPCALGLATPLAVVVAEGLCTKKGILVKSSEVLEKVSKIDVVIFDKTGTLTYGNLRISKMFNYSNYKDDEIIKMVASLESKSSHPISKAFLEYANMKKLVLADISDFENITGIGIKGYLDNKEIIVGNHRVLEISEIENIYSNDEKILRDLGNSIVYVVLEKKVIGLIGVCDVIRNSATNIVNQLKKAKKEVIMLTGDNEKTASIIASHLRISKVLSNIMPTSKTEVIKKLLNDGKKVMMVGDGINDAPSLASASIGVSITSGTDIAINSADVIILNDNLETIIDLINIGKKTIKIIKQNLFWAFFYNIFMLPIAMGLLSPWKITINPVIGSISMMISSLIVVFNSLRLQTKEKDKA